MQDLLLFCIYDSKAEMYLPPWSAMNRAVAHRIFETAVLQEGHDFNVHADDYSLWEVGSFNPEKAELKPHTLTNIVNAHHILNRFNNKEQSSG